MSPGQSRPRSRAEILPHLERLTQQLDMPIVYVSHAVSEAQLADALWCCWMPVASAPAVR
jgi:ABC-type molybdate transport system ATPase subunit